MRWLWAAAILAIACGDDDGSAAGTDPAPVAPAVAVVPPSSEPAELDGDAGAEPDDDDGASSGEVSADGPQRPFPPEVRSVRLRRSITVRMQPSDQAPKYGTIAAYTRAAFVSAAEGPGCQAKWIQIRPFGWVCGDYLEPSERPPRGIELPTLEPRELVPGVYGKVIAEGAQAFTFDSDEPVPARELGGSVHVRRYREKVLDELTYWNIGDKEWIPADSLRVHRPSSFAGVRLGDDTGRSLPLVFAVDFKRLDRSVPTTARPDGGKRVRRVAGRSAWPVLEVAGDGAAFRIGPDEWLPRRSAKLVEAAPPPADLRPGEKWIDVDLDRQVLVAYEGTLPVYATLVSSGSRKHPTETGVYRIWIKFSETKMSDQMAETPYSVATVPWTQFYSKDLALHTSYWHDGFGTRRSHGCINLAPIDSRFLYFWSDPEVPPGWSMAHGTAGRPGSLVRVRSRADPDPDYRGLY